jgi:hypothetical protein
MALLELTSLHMGPYSDNARGQGDCPMPNSPASEKYLNVVGYIGQIVGFILT